MMGETETKALTDLKSFLNKLFQFESQDLDFGIYKILHYKRKEVKEFIDKLLTDKVKEHLQVFDAEQKQQIENELKELEADENIQNYKKALTTDKAEAEILYKYNKKNIDQFLKLKKQVSEVRKTDNTDETIYNHLTLFFSRYYDKGDFISKRRFGKNEKYVVPYNGEETHFHWANHDQYYIKSSEYFQQFAFKVPQLKGTLTVNFKLTEAQTEQANVKAEENKYFVLSEKQAELSDTELNIFFEFHPLTEVEKKSLSGNGKQDLLNERAVTTLKEQLGKKEATAKLWEEDDKQQTLLLRKLHHYTRKNSYDFFIHKDLKGFLQRELDFYIKSELVKVEDLYVLDSEQHFNNIRHNFKLIKCFKNIADTIIDFLTQIEEFQKKLWEKKKFVLNTEWVVTIDKLAAWLDKEPFEGLVKQVLDNKDQVEEWKQLFGWEKLPFALTLEGLKADMHTWYKLPIDTKHFDSALKEALLNDLSKKINIEEEVNGLLIKSDNYHGLCLLSNKFAEKINSIYIDPPYNTSASEIIYKNSFRNSSWVSLIKDRVSKSKDFLQSQGNFCVTIDDVQMKELSTLISNEFGPENIAGVVSIRANPSGRPTTAGFAIAHEYAIFAKNSIQSKIWKLPRTETQLKRYNERDNESIFEWRNFRREGSNSNREDGKRQWYPIYATIQSSTIRIPEMEWGEYKEEWIIKGKNTKEETVIYPINEDGVEKNWRWSEDNVRDDYTQFECRLNNKGVPQVYYKYRPNTDGVTPLTFWADAKYSATEHGTKTLKDLFGIAKFSYPKSIWAVKDCLYIMGNELSNIILDYFPGSGTTFHSVQLLNGEDDGERKCILIEQGEYFYTIILPRIKKIAFSFDWEDSKPQNMNGLGVFIKYQRLEQYEEALENIAFTANEKTIQQAMAFENYMPKYFLELETRSSKTLVNIEAMQNPWGYIFKVWDGFTYDTKQVVDLVETFNYLIGLHVQKQFTWEEDKKKYVFVWGWNNEQKKFLIIWRDTTDWKEKDFEADRTYIESKLQQFEYDTMYINGQSTLPGYQMIEDIFKTKMIPT